MRRAPGRPGSRWSGPSARGRRRRHPTEPGCGGRATTLHALVHAWCDYLETCPFPGGCFITAASCELDGRPGELRDALRGLVDRWHDLRREQITAAQAAGGMPPDVRPDDVIILLEGLAMAASQQTQLLGEDDAVAGARRLMLNYLHTTAQR